MRPTINTLSWFSIVATSLLVLLSCRHYNFIQPSHPDLKTIALGPVENNTREPKLGIYLKQKLPELIMLDGTLKVAHSGDADAIVGAKILSYDTNTIGEVEIESEDSDQRKFRSSVFRVTVNVEYSILNAMDEQPASSETVKGIAEFSELVDVDIVRKDGLKRAIYDACDQIVSNLIETW